MKINHFFYIISMMNHQACFICLEKVQPFDIKHCCFGELDGFAMPCCGQNGKEPPYLHIKCYVKLLEFGENCPLCRTNLIPYLEGFKCFDELKK